MPLVDRAGERGDGGEGLSGDSEGFAAMWAKDAVFVFPDGSEQEVWATAEFP